jgi:MFS family permease
MVEHFRTTANSYRRYMLGLLLVLLAFNYMERFALGVVLQSIKIDLTLTDTQLGLLTGIAFALFYSVMGLPMARWADRGNRVTLISLTAALWSVAVALCGTAHSFVQLLLIRVAVGVGEAGSFIPGSSLIADYFSRAERPRALGIYTLGGALSIIIGYSLAGWLNELYGWRVVFILLGTPGLVLAVIVRLTLKEPRVKNPIRTSSVISRSDANGMPVVQPSLKEICVRIFAIATFRHLLLCNSVMYFFVNGVLQWQPSFFIRSYGLSTAQIGAWFAATYGLGGLLGTYLGGAWASRYAAHNERLQLRVISIGMACSAVLSAIIYLSSSHYLSLGLMGLVIFALSASNGPVYATIQSLVPERMRAVSVAVVLFFANLIGLGLGPLAAGALSDALRPWAGEESLRYALLMLAPGYLWAAWHAWLASKTVAHDLAAMSVNYEGIAPAPLAAVIAQ